MEMHPPKKHLRLCAAVASLLIAGLGGSKQVSAALIHHFEVESETAGVLANNGSSTIEIGYTEPTDGTLSTSRPGILSTQSFNLREDKVAITIDGFGDEDKDGFFMTQSYTVALWYKGGGISVESINQPNIIGVMENVSPYRHNFTIRDRDSNTWHTLRFVTRDVTLRSIDLNSSVKIKDEKWHHLAVTFDWNGVAGDDATAKMYVDGVETASAMEYSWYGWVASQQTFSGLGYPDEMFPGMYDDIRIYDTALTQTEIQTIMNAVGTPPPSEIRIKRWVEVR